MSTKPKTVKVEDRAASRTVASKGGFYVRAVAKGQDPSGQIREPGDKTNGVFFLDDPKFFSDAECEREINVKDEHGKPTGVVKKTGKYGWMERVDKTTAVHEIAIEKAKDHAAIANTVPGTGDNDVL